MAVHSYADLIQHDGHNVVIVTYADGANVAIECEDCYTVLLDYDRPGPVKVCKACGSDRVMYDAYVYVNDPTDVRTFQQVICDDCGGETSLTDGTIDPSP